MGGILNSLLGRGSNQHTSDVNKLSCSAVGSALDVSADSIGRAKKLLASGRSDLIENVKKGASIVGAVRWLEMAQNCASVRRIAKKNKLAKAVLEAMIASGKKFDVIYIDPPWQYSSGPNLRPGDPGYKYPTMPLQQIKDLNVGAISAPNSICWLWIPNCLLKNGLAVLESWGFEYVTNLVWAKTTCNPSPGAIVPAHEMVLVGKHGQGLPTPGEDVARIWSWFQEQITEHSAKPLHFEKELNRIYPNAAKIDMFSRPQPERPEDPNDLWVRWGNEAFKKAVPAPAAKSTKSK
jgi:N6-adenosine-specific RNA methylase IME4